MLPFNGAAVAHFKYQQGCAAAFAAAAASFPPPTRLLHTGDQNQMSIWAFPFLLFRDGR